LFFYLPPRKKILGKKAKYFKRTHNTYSLWPALNTRLTALSWRTSRKGRTLKHTIPTTKLPVTKEDIEADEKVGGYRGSGL